MRDLYTVESSAAASRAKMKRDKGVGKLILTPNGRDENELLPVDLLLTGGVWDCELDKIGLTAEIAATVDISPADCSTVGSDDSIELGEL